MERTQSQRLFPFLNLVNEAMSAKKFVPTRETGTRGVPHVIISSPDHSEKALVWFDRRSNGTHIMYSADPWALEKGTGFSVVLKDGWDEEKVTEVALCCFAFAAAPAACRTFLPPNKVPPNGGPSYCDIRSLRETFSKTWAQAKKDGYDGLKAHAAGGVLAAVDMLKSRWSEFTGDDIRQARERALKELVFLASKGLSQSNLEAICGEAVVQVVMRA